MSRNHGGERYVKSFDGWHHLLTMLYAVILRFDSLREIEASMLAEVRKWGHLGLKTIPRRSTLSDANSRRSEKFFEDVYRDLYEANKVTLSSDSRRNGTEAWIKRHHPLPCRPRRRRTHMDYHAAPHRPHPPATHALCPQGRSQHPHPRRPPLRQEV